MEKLSNPNISVVGGNYDTILKPTFIMDEIDDLVVGSEIEWEIYNNDILLASGKWDAEIRAWMLNYNVLKSNREYELRYKLIAEGHEDSDLRVLIFKTVTYHPNTPRIISPDDQVEVFSIKPVIRITRYENFGNVGLDYNEINIYVNDEFWEHGTFKGTTYEVQKELPIGCTLSMTVRAVDVDDMASNWSEPQIFKLGELIFYSDEIKYPSSGDRYVPSKLTVSLPDVNSNYSDVYPTYSYEICDVYNNNIVSGIVTDKKFEIPVRLDNNKEYVLKITYEYSGVKYKPVSDVHFKTRQFVWVEKRLFNVRFPSKNYPMLKNTLCVVDTVKVLVIPGVTDKQLVLYTIRYKTTSGNWVTLVPYNSENWFSFTRNLSDMDITRILTQCHQHFIRVILSDSPLTSLNKTLSNYKQVSSFNIDYETKLLNTEYIRYWDSMYVHHIDNDPELSGYEHHGTVTVKATKLSPVTMEPLNVKPYIQGLVFFIEDDFNTEYDYLDKPKEFLESDELWKKATPLDGADLPDYHYRKTDNLSKPEVIVTNDSYVNTLTPSFTARNIITESYGKHNGEMWEIREVGATDLTFTTGIKTLNLKELKVDDDILKTDTQYEVRYRFRSQKYGWSVWSDYVKFYVSYTKKPNMVEVVTPDILNPTLKSGGFDTPLVSGKHIKTEWRIRSSNDDRLVFTYVTVKSEELNQYMLPAGYLNVSTSYIIDVRYFSDVFGWSNWSDVTSFRTVDFNNVRTEILVSDNTLQPSFTVFGIDLTTFGTVESVTLTIKEKGVEVYSKVVNELTHKLEVSTLKPSTTYTVNVTVKSTSGVEVIIPESTWVTGKIIKPIINDSTLSRVGDSINITISGEEPFSLWDGDGILEYEWVLEEVT